MQNSISSRVSLFWIIWRRHGSPQFGWSAVSLWGAHLLLSWSYCRFACRMLWYHSPPATSEVRQEKKVIFFQSVISLLQHSILLPSAHPGISPHPAANIYIYLHNTLTIKDYSIVFFVTSLLFHSFFCCHSCFSIFSFCVFITWFNCGGRYNLVNYLSLVGKSPDSSCHFYGKYDKQEEEKLTRKKRKLNSADCVNVCLYACMCQQVRSFQCSRT